MQDNNKNKIKVVVHIEDVPEFYSAYAKAVIEAVERLEKKQQTNNSK